MKFEIIYLYENRTDVSLTGYILDDSPKMLNGKKRPSILICPGGAYMKCSDREAEPIALKFNSMGYHAFVLRYSVPNPAVEETLHGTYPAPMLEIGMSMQILRNHSEEWLIDCEKIALCGFSAGAHNCAMYSTHWNMPIITDTLHAAPEDIRPALCILGYPLVDYHIQIAEAKSDPLASSMFEEANLAFLGTASPSKELLDAVSVPLHVNQNTPPTFFWATYEDSLVPVRNSIALADAFAKNHIPFEMHIFEKGDHGYSLATKASAEACSQINPDIAKWTELVETWMDKRFAFELPLKTKREENV